MTRVGEWTFKQLKKEEPVPTDVALVTRAFEAARTSWICCVVGALCTLAALGAGFGIGWIYTDGYWGIFDPIDRSTGSYVWSAMELRKAATGNNSDDDLEQILHFVVSDMGALWTYKELAQRGGVQRMDTVLWYHPDRGQPGRFDYNLQLERALPSRMDRHAKQDWWGTSQNTGASSCICGWMNVDIMQIFYNEDCAMCRVSVTAHEYYHVLQMHYCPTVYDDRTHFVMWLSEGAATVMQNLYATYWLRNHSMYHDSLFDYQYGHVRQMMDKVQAGEYVYSGALNSHAGSQNNYIASTTALLYLMHRKGGSSYVQYMLVDFLFSGDCDLAANGGRDAGFQNAFGIWPTLDSFYSELNTFLNSANASDPASSIEPLRPSMQSIINLFNHTTLCSDVCELSRNGVCDAECLYGSDCTDCGPVAVPEAWPIELRYEWQDPNSYQSRAYYPVF